MALTTRLTIFSAIYLTDGGTTSLYAFDAAGRTHSITLAERAFVATDEGLSVVPGRLHFDGRQVEVRSEEERQIVSLLRAAETVPPPNVEGDGMPRTIEPTALILGPEIERYFSNSVEENLSLLRDEMVALIESEAYLGRASEEGQDEAGPRYDAWVVWKGRDRKRTIGRLANAFQMGARRARALIDDDRPILTQARGPAVATLRTKLRELGLGLRTQPEYKWL